MTAAAAVNVVRIFDRYLHHRDFQAWVDPIVTDGARADAIFQLVD